MSIKPCIFCKNDDKKFLCVDTYKDLMYTITCRRCEAQGPLAASIEDATKAWNKPERPKK
jgi:hypothetical protein